MGNVGPLASLLAAPALLLGIGLAPGETELVRHPIATVSALSDTMTNEALYRAACAACHGADGTGASRAAVGFEEPLPDFTDCSFATREPDADWAAVVHEGGPVRGFSPMMPAFGDALSDREVEKALAHVRDLCPSPAWPRGELNLPRPLFTEKAYPVTFLEEPRKVPKERTGLDWDFFVADVDDGSGEVKQLICPKSVRQHLAALLERGDLERVEGATVVVSAHAIEEFETREGKVVPRAKVYRVTLPEERS